MARSSFACLVVLILAWPTAAQEVVFPKTPPPEFAIVTEADKEKGTLKIASPRIKTFTIYVDRVSKREGKLVKERMPILDAKLDAWAVELSSPLVRVLDYEGRELSEEEMWHRLTPGRMVLRQVGLQNVDPCYLQLMGPDVLILAPQGKALRPDSK